MTKWFGWIGMTVVGTLLGWLGSRWGIFSGFVFGMVGTGLGLYLGRRVGSELE